MIATATDLNNIRTNMGSITKSVYYKQTADLDLSVYTDNWAPIGNDGDQAYVHYDGNGFRIRNLEITRGNQNYVGLFGALRNGSVRNLALVDVDVVGMTMVGSLVGYANNSIIAACSASGSVIGQGALVGGLVGLTDQVTIYRAYFYDGSVSAGESTVGGIAGRMTGGGALEQSYAAAHVVGSLSGGLIGTVPTNAAPTITASYWDTQTSGQAASAGGSGAMGRTTAQMQQRATFSGWDFANTWQLYTGKSYPYLRVLADTVADPVLNPGSGEYAGSSVTVTATCATAGATIHYAIGLGTVPDDQTTNTVGSGGTIEVPILETLNVVAWVPYMNPSPVVSAIYDPADAVATPTVDPDPGTYPGTNLAVVVSCATPDAVIRYTTDGSEPDETSTLVPAGGGVTIPLPCTLKAKAWSDGLNPSFTFQGDYEQMPTMVPPAFNPDGGSFTGSTTTVEITCATDGAVIRYTTDGSDPDNMDPDINSGDSVVVPVPGTLKARAEKPGYTDSAIKSAQYNAAGAVATPVFLPDGGAIAAGNVSVTITCETTGAVIRYTTDGSEPGESSPEVASGGMVTQPAPGTLKAKAWASGLNPSAVKSAIYTTAGVVAKPVFSPAESDGTENPISVTMTCATTGATIRYTTDGSDPLYGGTEVPDGTSIPVATPATLKARAFRDGLFPSPFQTGYYGSFAGGSGTTQNPYQIATATHLDKVRNHLDVHFVIIADIDLGVSPWNGGDGWLPLGTSASAFNGTLDGQGHVISNLFINRPTTDFVGLFGFVQSAGIILNLGLKDGTVAARQYVGFLAGYNYGIIDQCFATGAVTGNKHVGGLVGQSGNKSSCENSYALGSVTASGSTPSILGGFAGSGSQGAVIDCYAAGSVTPTNLAGGLIGYQSLSSVTASYWDTQTSGLSSSAGGTGKTTAQMYQQATFGGWDFATVWRIEEGVDYPRLRVFDPLSSSVPPDAWLIRYYGSVAAAPETSVKDWPLYWEYVADTDPTDPASRFAVTTASSATNTLSLSVHSATGRQYRVLSRTSLTSGGWQPASDEVPGTGGELTFEFPAPAVRTFYRLGVELAD